MIFPSTPSFFLLPTEKGDTSISGLRWNTRTHTHTQLKSEGNRRWLTIRLLGSFKINNYPHKTMGSKFNQPVLIIYCSPAVVFLAVPCIEGLWHAALHIPVRSEKPIWQGGNWHLPWGSNPYGRIPQIIIAEIPRSQRTEVGGKGPKSFKPKQQQPITFTVKQIVESTFMLSSCRVFGCAMHWRSLTCSIAYPCTKWKAHMAGRKLAFAMGFKSIWQDSPNHHCRKKAISTCPSSAAWLVDFNWSTRRHDT